MEKEYDGKRKVFLRMVISACIAVFVFGHPLSASADVIFEPDNDFYGRHSDECTYFNRSCIAGADTYLWDAPNLVTGGQSAQEGEQIYISFVYTDRTESSGGWRNYLDQWILMAICILNTEARNSWRNIQEKYMKMNRICFQAEQYLYHASYPESGDIDQADASVMDDYEITTFYTDPDGRLWGYSAYMYGSRDIWICLSDMADTNIHRRVEHELIPAQEVDASQIAAVKESGQFSVLFLVIPVIIIAGIAGFLIWRFWIRK